MRKKTKYLQVTRADHSPVAVIKIKKSTTQSEFEKKLRTALEEDYDAEIKGIDYPDVNETVRWYDGDTLRFEYNVDGGPDTFTDTVKIHTTWVY